VQEKQEKQELMFPDVLLLHLGGKYFAVAASDRFESQTGWIEAGSSQGLSWRILLPLVC